MLGFKQFEDYDKECEECIFEHEHSIDKKVHSQGINFRLNGPIRGGSKRVLTYMIER